MGFDYTLQPGRVDRTRTMQSGEKPLISIITPYYNGKKYVDQTFQCIVNQTFPYFEWLIVDDGSTDPESLEKLEELAAKDARIKILHKENGGIATARNCGLKHASCDLIFIIDCDDLIEPTYLEYCWWMLQKNPKAAWAFADSCGFDMLEYVWHCTFDPMRMKKENHITATALIRKSALESVGGYYDKGPKHFNEDWHLWLKLIAQGQYPVQSQGEELFWYRRRGNGVLSIVQGQEDDINKRLIQQAADQVVAPHKPKIYPNNEGLNWTHPRMSQWNRKVFGTHDKIHVAFLIPWIERSSADKFNLDLIAGLDPDQYQVGILTTERGENKRLQAARELTSDIFNLPNFCELKDYAEFVSYYIKSREVDVLFISNSYHGYGMAAWLRQNFPELVIVDYVHSATKYWRNGGYARTSSANRSVIEKTYVCNSMTRKEIVEDFQLPEEQMETVYIGVDEEHFCRENIRPGITYQELDIEEGRPIVLFVARLHPEKRPLLVLEIAQQVKKEIPDVAFVIVGDGELRGELEAGIKQKELTNTVYLAGARKEVRPSYRDARITLLPSLNEGLALTAFESLSMGVPMVSANVGGQADLIDDQVGALIECRQKSDDLHGRSGVDQEELKEYADAICKILKNDALWEQLSENCRRRIEERFTIRDMAEHFKAEFQRLLSDPKAKEKRRAVSEALCQVEPLAAEYCMMELQEYTAELGYNWQPMRQRDQYFYETNQNSVAYAVNNARVDAAEMVLNRHEEVVNRHEEVLNRHEEVLNRHEEVVNRHEEVVNRHEEMVNRHEEVVNRHEEVVNRHEEAVNRHEKVINRHESSINHQWEVQKWHEERIAALEQNMSQGILKRIYHKLFKR